MGIGSVFRRRCALSACRKRRLRLSRFCFGHTYQIAVDRRRSVVTIDGRTVLENDSAARLMDDLARGFLIAKLKADGMYPKEVEEKVLEYMLAEERERVEAGFVWLQRLV